MLGPMTYGVLSSGGATGPSSLLIDLVAYWKLDEESGVRVDSVASNDLADINTVTFDTGKQGNAAQFTAANSEYLSIDDNADLSMGLVDFTVAVWVKLASKPTSAPKIINKYTNTGNNREYSLDYYHSPDRFRWVVSNNGDGGGSFLTLVQGDSSGPISIGVWYFIVVEHDETNEEIYITVNDGTRDSAAHTGGVFDGIAKFLIGGGQDGTASFFDGVIDEVGIWKRLLTSEEKTALYNGGDGITYPFEGTLPGGQGSGGNEPTLPEMEADEFMIAIIPDTQWYPWQGTPEFDDMTEWIAAHAADSDKNIQMVLHEGDVIWSLKGNLSTQFTRADAAMDILDAANIPYLICMGNHDYDSDTPPPADRSHTQFDAAFPQSRFTGQTGWDGGFYQATTFDGNAYWARTIGGNDYLFLAISFGPTQDVIDWAAGVIDAHPGYDVWIVTHAYMYRDGTRLSTGDEWNPHDLYVAGTDTHDGEEMWDELVKLKANVVWIQNGHDGISTADGWVQARRQDNGDGGNLVNQVVANYHTTEHGGRGYMRLVAVRPTANRVDVYTYSPNINDWFRNDANEFSVDYKNVA